MNQNTAALKALDSIQLQLKVKLTEEQRSVVYDHFILMYGVGYNETHQDKKNVKPVEQYADRKRIKVYRSVTEAAKAVQVHRRSIQGAIDRNGTCKGFVWKWA